MALRDLRWHRRLSRMILNGRSEKVASDFATFFGYDFELHGILGGLNARAGLYTCIRNIVVGWISSDNGCYRRQWDTCPPADVVMSEGSSYIRKTELG